MSVDGLHERFLKRLERDNRFVLHVTPKAIFMQALVSSADITAGKTTRDALVIYVNSRSDYEIRLGDPLIITRDVFVKPYGRIVTATRTTWKIQVENNETYTEMALVHGKGTESNRWSTAEDAFLSSRSETLATIVGRWANEQVRLGKGVKLLNS